MSHINDYIKWRGDLPFSSMPINMVDLALLSQLTILNIDEVLTDDDIINGFTVQYAVNKYYNLKKDKQIGLLILSHIPKTIYEFANQDRYKNLIITNYKKVIDEHKTTQFCALTIELNDDLKYVIFSGTDDSIVGWKENFMMLYTPRVNAQKLAKEYLQEVSTSATSLIVGGHSKGGNLATYSACKVSKDVRSKIKSVYSFDGPGFSSNIYKTPGYKHLKEIIYHVIPQCSVIGLLLHHEEKKIIIKCNSKGLLQHDVTTWEVSNNSFEQLNELDKEAIHVDKTIKQLTEKLNHDEKVRLVETFFKILSCEDNKYLIDLKIKKKAMLHTFFKSDKEEKRIIYLIFKVLFLDNIIRNGIIANTYTFNKSSKAIKKQEKKENKLKQSVDIKDF